MQLTRHTILGLVVAVLLQGAPARADDQSAARQASPEPIQVTAIAIGDQRCGDCDVAPFVERLKSRFPGLDVRILDWSDREAKKIFKDARLRYLPAILFDDSVEWDKDGYRELARYVLPAGQYRSMRLGASFDPTAEICDNQRDDTGDGKVDCDDPGCAATMVCRPEKVGQLDVFVMSQCPYGVRALDVMKEVLAAFDGEIQFTIHYIADPAGEGFHSMHGQAEVDEDIRELCAMKHYPNDNKFMDYIWCRNRNIRSGEWQGCTGNNGISTPVIESCATGEEGRHLLAEDITVAKALDIGASPTWMVNNRYIFHGITAEVVRKNICRHNPEFAGCARSLSNEGGVQGGCGQ